MKKLLISSLILLSANTSYADNLTATQKISIERLIDTIKSQDSHTISKVIYYPLTRTQPIPEIKNKNEFKQRFSQIFDQTLFNQITRSKPEDWSQMGWRGIMLNSGSVWISNVDDDQPSAVAKITAINYSSTAEKALAQHIILEQKQKLHSSLQTFSTPELLFKTPDYLIRIDQLHNGQYRYASWKGHQDQSKKPDLIFNKGSLEADGTGGNYHFTFKNGPYIYIIHRNIMGAESNADTLLFVYKDEKTLIEQEGYFLD